MHGETGENPVRARRREARAINRTLEMRIKRRGS